MVAGRESGWGISSQAPGVGGGDARVVFVRWFATNGDGGYGIRFRGHYWCGADRGYRNSEISRGIFVGGFEDGIAGLMQKRVSRMHVLDMAQKS